MIDIENAKITRCPFMAVFIRKELFMSSVRRVYVEKKPDFAVQAKELKHEISSYLGIKDVAEISGVNHAMMREYFR